jgi:hypothetical protein
MDYLDTKILAEATVRIYTNVSTKDVSGHSSMLQYAKLAESYLLVDEACA